MSKSRDTGGVDMRPSASQSPERLKVDKRPSVLFGGNDSVVLSVLGMVSRNRSAMWFSWHRGGGLCSDVNWVFVSTTSVCFLPCGGGFAFRYPRWLSDWAMNLRLEPRAPKAFSNRGLAGCTNETASTYSRTQCHMCMQSYEALVSFWLARLHSPQYEDEIPL